jgi:hypothetical protein
MIVFHPQVYKLYPVAEHKDGCACEWIVIRNKKLETKKSNPKKEKGKNKCDLKPNSIPADGDLEAIVVFPDEDSVGLKGYKPAEATLVNDYSATSWRVVRMQEKARSTVIVND